MGFISSILCCLTDSPKSKSQRQVNPDKKNTRTASLGSPNKQSAIHSSLSNSSHKMLHSIKTSNSKNVVGNSNRDHIPTSKKKLNNVGSEKGSKYSHEGDSNDRDLTEKDRIPKKKRYSDTTLKSVKKRGQGLQPLSNHKTDDGIDDEEKGYDNSEEEEVEDDEEEDEEKAEAPNNDKGKLEVDASNEKDKQGVYVYNGETDTSTGGSSYDHPQQKNLQNSTPVKPQGAGQIHSQPPSQTEMLSTDGTSSSHDPELITTVHEGENYSSADDTDIALQRKSSNNEEDEDYDMAPPYEEDEDYVDLTELQPGQAHASGYKTLLAPQDPKFLGKKCLVLDLDETLVHSSFKYLRTADFVLPVDIDDQIHNVYVIKRPGVDDFLKRVGAQYEVVVFTASVSRYGDPLLDILDKHKLIHHRLFRESCYNYEGNYIKNLSQIGRPLSDIIILDNSPASYIFHPQHAIPRSSWFSDTHDNELLDIIPLLEDLSESSVPDVAKVLDVTI
mgnify:CR=1 FL=1